MFLFLSLLRIVLIIVGYLLLLLLVLLLFLQLLFFIVIVVVFLSRSVDIERELVLLWEKDKNSELLLLSKSLQIDRLRVVFNKLGSSVESQVVVVVTVVVFESGCCC